MVGGMYKCYKAGTCQDKCGSKMASVLIDRDKQRNICLSSIAPMMKKKASDEEEEEVVVILRQDYRSATGGDRCINWSSRAIKIKGQVVEQQITTTTVY